MGIRRGSPAGQRPGVGESARLIRCGALLALLGLAACGLPQTPGQAPSAGTYNPVSKTFNDR